MRNVFVDGGSDESQSSDARPGSAGKAFVCVQLNTCVNHPSVEAM